MTVEHVAGCDMGVPVRAGDQAKKIILIEATRVGAGRYEIEPGGRNERLTKSAGRVGWYARRRGWTITDLRDTLISDPPLVATGLDFPFSIPLSLLQSKRFAEMVGHGHAFQTRSAWSHFVANQLELGFATENASAQLKLGSLVHWRDKNHWSLRETDAATNAQPPLKHLFQCLFNMTVVGAALLHHVEAAGSNLMLLPLSPSAANEPRTLFETYPGQIARSVGFGGNYKKDPLGAMNAARTYLRERGIRVTEDENIRQFCEEYRTGDDDPDGADAFLCLVAAIAWRENIWQAHDRNASDTILQQEGCIVTPA
ncbi:MAG: hypothetical protein ACI97A_002951 [Planctomycetota bacterium]|jgi:hypothetical protein